MRTFYIALLVLSALVASPRSTLAQDGSGGDWQTGASALQCTPACRGGFECQQGECIPVCAPACGPDSLCTSGGKCVRTEPDAPAPEPRSTWRAPTNQCLPTCRSGFTCVGGQCVSACNPACAFGQQCTPEGQCITSEAAPAEDPAAAPLTVGPRSDAADSIVNLHIDLLGALQFGLTPTVEVGKTVSGYLRLRALNTGLASYFLLGRDRDDELKWGVGAALGLHVFSGRDGNMRGLFGGPALEYVFVETRDVKRDLASYRDHALIPQLDFGNRWVFDRLLLGLGLRVGLSVPVQSSAKPVGNAGCVYRDSCTNDAGLSFVASAFLDLGWFFGH